MRPLPRCSRILLLWFEGSGGSIAFHSQGPGYQIVQASYLRCSEVTPPSYFEEMRLYELKDVTVVMNIVF